MKLIQFIATASFLASCASFASPVPENSQGSSLNQCQKRFGSSGLHTYVFGFLPLQGDVFHGRVTIGERVQKDEVTAETPFTDGSLEYFFSRDAKVYDLTLMPNDKPEDASVCEDYESEAGSDMEVVQFNWNGKPPMNEITSWSLKYHSLGPLSCYIGAEPGDAEIVLMCKVHVGKTLVYPYQIFDELKALFSKSEIVNTVCQSLGEEARRGTEEKCKRNIKNLDDYVLNTRHNQPLKLINGHDNTLK